MGHFRLYEGDKATGMSIGALYEIVIRRKRIRLPHPVFHVYFYPGHAEKHIHLVDMPTLGLAKKLAERCYAEWVKIGAVKVDAQ